MDSSDSEAKRLDASCCQYQDVADHQFPKSDSIENQPEQMWKELGDEAHIFSRCPALGHISSFGAEVLSVAL